uniref:Lipocalin domain-containing protein n=1 Tax=Ditylenchus dipsaci TaxID=166011 RepID=A0A915EPM1_9BILA
MNEVKVNRAVGRDCYRQSQFMSLSFMTIQSIILAMFSIDRLFKVVLVLVTLLVVFTQQDAAVYFGGIPVPGRRVPAMRSFELYMASCRPSFGREGFILEQLQQMLQHVNAEQLAEKMQRHLYFAVDDLDVDKTMGKWFTVVDSPSVHSERCAVSYFKLLEKNRYSASFTTTQYATSHNDDTKVIHGSGRKNGPDPGSLLFLTGHPADPCPYFPVKSGPQNELGEYEYLVMTQALKQPTMVLARDPVRFEQKYKKEVEDYLNKYGYMNPASPLYFVNATTCLISNSYYTSIEEDDI